MTGQDLLAGMSYIDRKFITELCNLLFHKTMPFYEKTVLEEKIK